MQRGRINLCVTNETYLLPSVAFNLCNFSTYLQDRLDRGGGGKAILIRRNVQHNVISFPALQSIEAAGVSLQLNQPGAPAGNCSLQVHQRAISYLRS
ncbi:hypothetical protein Zmor_028513 [Zophobas morio]|uniref:Uncharacterized protein n=1 Tax=Zophobas morio TaxID=2755281 RepID=A0AA38LZW9_9CUCU|nr:hypothetical protein Zmor_028513 [Zophobas morio]